MKRNCGLTSGALPIDASRQLRIAVGYLLLVLLNMLCGQVARAQSPSGESLSSLELPHDPAKNAGFQCDVEVSSGMRPGYDRVRVTCNLPVAASGQRSITARLSPLRGEMVPLRNSIEVELPITIEQGSTRLEVTRYVPKWLYGNSYTIQLFEGGRPLDAYIGEIGMNLPNRRVVADQILAEEVFREWLVVEPSQSPATGLIEPKTIQDWLDLIPQPDDRSTYYPISSSRGPTTSTVAVTSIALSHLPTDWRNYRDYDSVVVDAATLQKLKTENPSQFKALNRWILLGGTMVVRGIIQSSDLATVLGRPISSWNANAGQRQIELAVEGHLLTLEQVRMFLKRVVIQSFPSNQERLEHEELVKSFLSLLSQHDSIDGQKLLDDIKTSVHAIQYENVGAGHVVGFRDDFPESFAHWSITDQLLSTWNSPALRRGVDPLFGDSRFRRWLIPGVAQPPVYTFMGLLSVFVILVGPVAYRQTTRRGRGYLMFAIAPVLALLTTASMFAYGIVADGFGTVARIRQITWVDGASGDAVTRTRGTYFAGIRPADGLRFDADAEVLWYPDAVDMSWPAIMELNTPKLGTVVIDEVDQRFSSSFLPSRQQRQFVVHQAIPNVGSLTAKRIFNDTQPGAINSAVSLEVQNDLGMDLSQVVIRDDEGELWAVEKVLANSRIKIDAPILTADRSKLLGDLFNEQRVMEENSSAQRNGRIAQSFDLILQLNQRFMAGDREVTDGSLERWLRESLQLGGSLAPRTYIGLARIDPRFVAVEGTELVESVHFVTGTMP